MVSNKHTVLSTQPSLTETMSSSKTFELLVLVSLMNKKQYLHVTEDDVLEVVTHVAGPQVDPDSVLSVKDKVIDYLADKYPRLVEVAAMLINNQVFDEKRYGKLIDLYRKNHPIESMPVPEFA